MDKGSKTAQVGELPDDTDPVYREAANIVLSQSLHSTCGEWAERGAMFVHCQELSLDHQLLESSRL